MLTCKDICGNKCKKECEVERPHPAECKRGIITDKFMFCPMRPTDCDNVLSYVTYELVVDKHIKEGKKKYKKTEKIETDMVVQDFIDKFILDFPGYSKHTLEAWFLNVLKNAAFSPSNQPSHSMNCVSDFAQNLLLDKKHEVSEEYFHKTQTALFATVTSITSQIRTEDGSLGEKEKVQHTLSQITSSNNK